MKPNNPPLNPPKREMNISDSLIDFILIDTITARLRLQKELINSIFKYKAKPKKELCPHCDKKTITGIRVIVNIKNGTTKQEKNAICYVKGMSLHNLRIIRCNSYTKISHN